MKYILLEDKTKIVFGRKLFRVQYLRECGFSKEGGLGGFIESEECLSQEGESWVGDQALVFDNSKVTGNAKVYGSVWVHNYSLVTENASVFGNASVKNHSIVRGDARVFGDYIANNELIEGNQKRVIYG